MFRLSREVRFSVDAEGESALKQMPTNSFAGFPSLQGIGYFLTLEVTLIGDASEQTGCLVNIKDIDAVVRRVAIPLVAAFIRRGRLHHCGSLVARFYEAMKDASPGAGSLHHLRLSLSPFLQVTLFAREYPMVRISQKFEFSASHRLHNPALSDEQNRQIFGKCNNPHGHGHNYILQVAVAGVPDVSGIVIEIPQFERIVAASVIDRFDHKNLNVEIEEFKTLIPTVENIAMVIYRLLKPNFESIPAQLAGVTVWETPKTSCEYME